MSWLSKITRKNRSSTFGADELTKDKDVPACSQRRNLVASPVSSAVSGVGVLARKRSSTWHAAPVEVKQVDNDITAKCLPGISVPSLKEKFCQIITEELNKHLGNEKDLKASQEFVEKSAMIAKVISIRARQLISHNTKIVASVFVGEVRENGIEVASQSLFDPTQDALASGNFKSPHIFAIGTLFVTTYNSSLHDSQ